MSGIGLGSSKKGARTADSSMITQFRRVYAQGVSDSTYNSNPKKNAFRPSVSVVNTASFGAANTTYGNITGSTTIPTVTVPDAPILDSLTAASTTITVRFTAPTSDGGSEITDYEYSVNGGATFVSASTIESPFTITGLTNGTSYSVQVRAINSIGPGNSSNSLIGTPATVPSAPTALSSVITSGQVVVSFVSGSNGGSSITDYEYSIDNGTTFASASTTESPITVGGLTDGRSYRIKIRAVNAVGAGTASSTVRATPTPFSGMMLLLDAATYEAGNTWYDYSGNQKNATLVNSPTWSSANGGRYEFDGTNQYATLTSGFANFTSGITVLAIVDFGAANSFERIMDFGNGPENNNILLCRQSTGDNIFFEIYRGNATGGFRTVTDGIKNNQWGFYGGRLDGTNCKVITLGSSSTTAFTNLPVNVTRTLNYIGRSNWGDDLFQRYISVLAIFNTALSDSEITQFLDFYRNRYIPDPPTGLSATSTSTTITITFTPGSDNGNAISNYKYSTDGVNYTPLSPADGSSPITISGLSSGTTYNITLKAVNGFGDSAASSSISMTTSGIATFTTVDTTSWTAPAGITSVNYLVVGGGGGGGNGYDNGGGGGGGGGMVRSGTLSVTPGTSYTVTVGAGGAGGANIRSDRPGSNGESSVFDTITSLGGGLGKGSRTTPYGTAGVKQVLDPLTAPTGGSGSGGGAGGDGGGGAGADGTANSGTAGGAGGSGISSSISGVPVTYGEGGDGANSNSANGGGNDGAANTGTGGDGGGATSGNSTGGGAGQAGIVILSY